MPMPTFAKLNLKDQDEIVVLNAPASFEPELKSLKGVTVRRDAKGGDIGFSLAFVMTQKEVDTLGPQVAWSRSTRTGRRCGSAESSSSRR
jgi:hypothetical protein